MNADGFFPWSEESWVCRLNDTRSAVEEHAVAEDADKHMKMAHSEWQWYKCPDILMNVLSRLPVLQLRQCCCVSKVWSMTICDSHFLEIWLARNSSDNRWVAFLSSVRLTSSILFYNGTSDRWCMKEFEFVKVMASKEIRSEHWQIAKQTVAGLLFCIGFSIVNLNGTPHQALLDNLVVFNPITNRVRRLELPAQHVHGLNLMSYPLALSGYVSMLEHGGASDHGTQNQGRTKYKVFIPTYDSLHTRPGPFLVYSSVTERWKRVTIARKSCPFHPSGVDTNGARGMRIEGPVSVKRYSFAHIRLFPKDTESEHDLDCCELLQYDTEYDMLVERHFAVNPWSVRYFATRYTHENILRGYSLRVRPRFFVRALQINHGLVLPLIEVSSDNQCLTISISSLQGFYTHQQVDLRGCHTGPFHWATTNLMPFELFKTLHGANDTRCREHQYTEFRCGQGLICVADERTKQILFMNSTTSVIVGFHYEMSSPAGIRANENPWASLRHPLAEDMPIPLSQFHPQFTEVLRSPNLTALLPNFQIRLDSVP